MGDFSECPPVQGRNVVVVVGFGFGGLVFFGFLGFFFWKYSNETFLLKDAFKRCAFPSVWCCRICQLSIFYLLSAHIF